MPSTILTDLAETKIATAAGSGSSVEITHIALGDGNGVSYAADHAQVALRREMVRKAIDRRRFIEPKSWAATAEFGPETAAFSVREAGFFDADGDLIALCTFAANEVRQTGGITYIIEQTLHFSHVAEGLVVVSAPPAGVTSINGLEADANGDVDLADITPERAPDPATELYHYSDINGMGKAQRARFELQRGSSHVQSFFTGNAADPNAANVLLQSFDGAAVLVENPSASDGVLFLNARHELVATIGIIKPGQIWAEGSVNAGAGGSPLTITEEIDHGDVRNHRRIAAGRFQMQLAVPAGATVAVVPTTTLLANGEYDVADVLHRMWFDWFLLPVSW